MELLVRQLKILWSSERMLGEIKLKVFTHKIILGCISALAALFGLGMLNMAAFFHLQTGFGSATAALVVGLINLAFAAILIVMAQKLKPGPEIKVVEEVREMALTDLEAEAQAFQNEILKLRDEVVSMHASISRLISNPFEAFSPKMIVPIVAAITKLLSAHKDEPAKPAAKSRARRSTRKTK